MLVIVCDVDPEGDKDGPFQATAVQRYSSAGPTFRTQPVRQYASIAFPMLKEGKRRSLP